MYLIIAFGVFIALMLTSVILNISMIVPLVLGLILFGGTAMSRGFQLRPLLGMAFRGGMDAMVVVKIIMLIGCLTGLWRCSGTIAFLTYYGIKCVPPRAFILAAFLLSSVMSYLMGTSFGVAATVGVILITIARAGGVSPVIAGGAILSGVYFGDRGSPVASSASLVANVTKTNHNENIRLMLKASILPMVICTALYGALSVPNGMGSADSELLTLFSSEFTLAVWCAVPAVLLLALSFAGMRVDLVLIIDIVLTLALAVLVQKVSVMQALGAMVLGFTPSHGELKDILSGGGAVSMLEICALLLLSSACSGIFAGTEMLSPVEERLKNLSLKIGRFPVMVITGLGVLAIFCNQTIGVIMCRQCMSRAYPDTEAGRREMMLDIEDSVVPLSGVVPWCIACSVPLAMLDCGISSLPFAFYIYLLPLCHFAVQELHGRKKIHARQG